MSVNDYKFKFDTGFMGNRPFPITNEEEKVIRTIINGRHNAILYGYKPERLITVIKAVINRGVVHMEEPTPSVSLTDYCGRTGVLGKANNGILIMENLDAFSDSVIRMTNIAMTEGQISLTKDDNVGMIPTKFCLIATFDSVSESESDWRPMLPVADNCSIVYRCMPPSDNMYNDYYSKTSIAQNVCRDWINHVDVSQLKGKRNCEVSSLDELKFTTEGKVLLEDTVLDKYYNKLEVAKVARSVADMFGHTYIRTGDIETAKKLRGLVVNKGENNGY